MVAADRIPQQRCLPMPRPPRVIEVLLAIAVLACAMMSFQMGTVGRLLVGTVQLTAGLLLLLPRPLTRSCNTRQFLASLPALALGGVGLQVATPFAEWSSLTLILLGIGVTTCTVAYLSLGRSFGVLPAARPLVHHGPYRLVRHPAYLGHMMILVACGLSNSPWAACFLAACALPVLALRIRAEEQLLSETWTDYVAYCEHVRWRLCPMVW